MAQPENRYYQLNENLQFKQLPLYVQENIKQSGVQITSPEQLNQIAHNLSQPHA